ncbi:MAG: hypothetical protein GW880_15660 [Armatimonadetes bacterium]|nr:hypothetical protein [Armatimonadota bacterium]
MGLLGVLMGAAPPVAAQPFRFLLRADPSVLVADGHSTSTLSVQANATAGTTVGDGTEVRFVTTLGVITESARLLNGSARATLRSGTLAGTASITAIIGVSREQLELEFLPAGAAPSREGRLVAISGDYVAYSVERRVVTVSGKGSVRIRDLTIESDVKLTFQVDQERVLAEGRPGKNTVSLSNGLETVSGDQLSYDFRRRRGLLVRVSPKPARLGIQGEALATEENAAVGEGEWLPIPTEGTQTWIVARRITIFPQEKIQFHHASVYVNDIHVVSLPVHVMSLSSLPGREGVSSLFGDRVIGYNSTGGVSLDVPFYYRANTQGTGAVRLRHAGGDGFYTQQSGWSLALEEQYYLGAKGEGSLVLDEVPRSDWGVSLQHEQTFGPNERGYAFLDFPRHRDLFSRFSYYKRQPTFNFGAELYGTVPKEGRASGSSQLYWQLDPKPLPGTPLAYTVTGDLSLSHNFLTPGQTRFSQSVDFRVYPRALRLTPRTSLISSVQLDTYHDNTNRLDASVGGNLSLRHGLNSTSSLTLGYTYDPGALSYEGASTNEYLSLGMYASRGWRSFMSMYATRGLREDSLYGYGSLAYRLSPLWHTTFDLSYQDFSGITFTDYELGVGRTLGNLDARLAYSKSRGKVFLEFGTSMY